MKAIFLILTVLVISSCSSNTEKMDDLSWIAGNWTREYNGVTQVESWNKKATYLTGESIFVKNEDSTVISTFKITQMNNHIVLISKEVDFEDSTVYDLGYFAPDSVVFHTKKPIWPQTILLYKKDENTFIKSQTGVQQQMKNFVHFEFKKVTK